MAQLSLTTFTSTVTSGPPSDIPSFQGWYNNPSSQPPWQPINCDASSTLYSTAAGGYAVCCSLSATTCASTLYTSCSGNTAFGVTSIGSNSVGSYSNACFSCVSMSIYNEYSLTAAAGLSPATQIICVPPGNGWAADTIYRTLVLLSTSSSVVTITSTSATSTPATPAPAIVSSTPTTVSSTTANGSANTSPTPTASHSSGSKAWIAGVVIGPIVAIALSAIAVWLFCFRGKQRGTSNTATAIPTYPTSQLPNRDAPSPNEAVQPPEYHTPFIQDTYAPKYQGYQPPQSYEMSATHRTPELAG